MPSMEKINNLIRIASFIGFILSVYAYIVETSKERDPNYMALCDINEHMSCSKVFTSKYGRGFGLLEDIVGKDSIINQPNCLGGIFFYILIVLLSYFNTTTVTKVIIVLNIVANIASVYLAYILYFVLHDFCIVCISTYIVNALNLIAAIIKLNKLKTPAHAKTD